jgi:hypothetical protein
MFKQEEMGEIIDGHTLRFVRVVKHPPERVWRAITARDQHLDALSGEVRSARRRPRAVVR